MDTSPLQDPQPSQPPPRARIAEGAPHFVLADEPSAPPPAIASAPQGNTPSSNPRKRTNLLMAAGLAFLLLGLVALSTWWVLNQQGTIGGLISTGRSELPNDVVALINSSTPMPSPAAKGPPDSPGPLQYAPPSEGWTPALREADRALQEGRYPAALSQYSALVSSSDPSEARNALWGLASAYDKAGQKLEAARSYTLFATLDDPRSVRALVKLGQLLEAGGRGLEAMQLYREYADRGGPARHALRMRQARLMGNTEGAEKLYEALLNDKPLDIDRRQALLDLAEIKSKRGNRKEAAEVFGRLALLERDEPRPVLDHGSSPAAVRAAEETAQAGDKTRAERMLLDYLRAECNGADESCVAYPYGRYLGLLSLLKINPSAVVSGTIPPLEAAQLAFDAGNYGRAIGFLDTYRAAEPEDTRRAEAALMTGNAYLFSGDPAAAYNWFTATVQTYPASPQAPEAMRRAADALRDQAAWEDALATYTRAIEQYPGAGEETAQARINGGVLAYRLEQPDLALSMLQPLSATQSLTDTTRANAAFWLGKLQKRAGDASWRSSLEKVALYTPGTYLHFRASALLAGEPAGGATTPTFEQSGVSVANLGVRYSAEEKERADLLAWAANLNTDTARKPQIPTAATPTTPKPENGNPTLLNYSQDPELQRAATLLNLGWEREGYISFRALTERLRNRGNSEALAEVVTYLRYHAAPRTAMRVAETLAELEKDPLEIPTLLMKTLYPTPYGALVTEEAALRDIDPLAFYALIRQESQFVPDARSSADARGLAQVIPSTGEGIAEQLGDTRYSGRDLYLPYISVRYGAYYLASNLPQFDRQLLPTLAAYNGGPGNAARWLQGSALLDPDLFAERVDYFETEDYLRRVYTNYGFYKEIYKK